MHHTSSEEDSSPDCTPADLNAPICVFYFSHPYGIGSPHETARPTVRSNIMKRPGAARPRARRKPEVPPRRRKKRPDVRWRRFMRRPIHHLRSFLFVREQDLTGPSKFQSPLPDLDEVLRIVRQAWLSPRSCSLDSRCPTSNKNQLQEEPQGMGTGPKEGRALPHRRYSVPETVMRRYILSKQRSAGSSDSGVATVPPASPRTNSITSSRSSVHRMGHSLDSSDSGPGPNNSKGNGSQHLPSKKHNDERLSNTGSSSSECYDKSSKSLTCGSQTVSMKTCYRSKSVSDNSDPKFDPPNQYFESSEVVPQKLDSINKSSILQELICEPLSELCKEDVENVPEENLNYELQDFSEKYIETTDIKKDTHPIINDVNESFDNSSTLNCEEKNEINDDNYGKRTSQSIKRKELLINNNNSQLLTEVSLQEQILVDDLKTIYESKTETANSFSNNKNCDIEEAAIERHKRKFEPVEKNAIIISSPEQENENKSQKNVSLTDDEQNIVIFEDQRNSNLYSSHSVTTNEQTSGISSKYSNTSSAAGNISSDSKSDETFGYNDTPTSKTADSIYTTSEICTTTPDRVQAVSEMSDHVSESCSITPVGSSSDSNSSTTLERPETRLDTASSTTTGSSSTSTLYQTVSEHSTSTQDMTLSIRSDSDVTHSSLSTPASPGQESPEKINTATSCSESTQEYDHLASLEDYVNDDSTAKAEIILKAFRDRDKYMQPIKEMISQSTQTSHLNNKAFNMALHIEKYTDDDQCGTEKGKCDIMRVSNNENTMNQCAENDVSVRLNEESSGCSMTIGSKQITTVLPCKPMLSDILNVQTAKVKNDSNNKTFQKSLWLNRSLQNKNGFNATKISIKGVSKTEIHLPETVSNSTETMNNKIISQTAYNWSHITDHDRNNQNQILTENITVDKSENKTNEPCLSSCIGTGSTYRPLPDAQLIIPRYSALPRSISMLVNTSSGECSSNSNSDSECLSLVDSLEDSISPFQIKKLSRLGKSDVDKLLPDNMSLMNVQGRPECFFISFGEKEERDIRANVLSVSQTMPMRIKEKLLKRQHDLEIKRLQRQKSEEKKNNSNKVVMTKGKTRKIMRQSKINGKNSSDSSETTKLLTNSIQNLEPYESYIIIDIVDSSVHVQPPRNGCVTQPCITVSIEPETPTFDKTELKVRKTDENQNNINGRTDCSKNVKENIVGNSEFLNDVINDYFGTKIEVSKTLSNKCVAEKAIQTSDRSCEKNENKINSESNSNFSVDGTNAIYSQVSPNLNTIYSESPTRDDYLDSVSLNTDIDGLSDTVSSTDEDTISTKTCKSRKSGVSPSNSGVQDNEIKVSELASMNIIENNEGISLESKIMHSTRENIYEKETTDLLEQCAFTNKENQEITENCVNVEICDDDDDDDKDEIQKEDKGAFIINENRKHNEDSRLKESTKTDLNEKSENVIKTENNSNAENNKMKNSEPILQTKENVYLKIPKAVSLSEEEIISYHAKDNISPNNIQQNFTSQSVKISSHSQINEKSILNTKNSIHKSHIPVMKSPISQYKVLKENLDFSNQNDATVQKPSHLPVRKTSNPLSPLQSPPIRRSANILTNRFKQHFEVIPEERSCSLESSTEDQNKTINNESISHSIYSINKENTKNVAHEIAVLNNIEGSYKVSQRNVEKFNIFTSSSRKPFAYKPRIEKENSTKDRNLKSVPARKGKTKNDRIRRDMESESTVQDEHARMSTRRKRHIPEESSSSNGDSNVVEHSKKSSVNSASRLTRRPIRQPKVEQNESSFQQIEEIVTLRPEITNCYKGKASLATQAEDPDLLSLSKGWINFYLLKNNQGTSEDSNQEDAHSNTDGRVKSRKYVTPPKTVTVVGGESHRVRQYTVPTRSICENNIEEVTVLPELIRRKSVQATDKPITPSPAESDHSTTYLEMPSSTLHIQNYLDGSGDLACSESSSSVSSSSDSDIDHGASPSLLPTRWPVRQWRNSKPSRQRQRNQYGRMELAQYPTHFTNEGIGNSNSGWTVTLAGTANCPQPPPHDVEMKLSFPACSRRQPASQSDSGLGEDNNHHNEEIKPSLPQPSRSNTPSQQWSFTVKNSQGGINRGRDDCKNSKMSYECLPDLTYHSGQSRNAKKVIKRRPDTGFPMTSVPAEDIRRASRDQYSKLWPKVQKVLESKVIICKSSGQVSHQVRSVSHLLEDDVDVIHTQTELEVTGSAITPEKKPRVPTMSERDLTRGHTARRKTTNTTTFNYNYLGH